MDADKGSPVDPDARFGTNNERRRYVFGYKLHVAVDAGSGLVRALVTTPANVQAVALAGDHIQGVELAVHVDRSSVPDWLYRARAARVIADGRTRRHRNAVRARNGGVGR